jgi:hypothetical protein
MRNTRSRKSHHSGKENGTASLPSVSSASSSKGKEKAVPKASARNVKAKRDKEESLFCSCRGVDDGTPMVQCGNCDEWSGIIVISLFFSTDDRRRYHFRCVNLNEDDASEISESFVSISAFTGVTSYATVVYVCPACQEKTGWRTVSKCQTRFRYRYAWKTIPLPHISFLPYCCTPSYCNTRTTIRVRRNTLSFWRLPA